MFVVQLVKTVSQRWFLPAYTKWTVFIKYLIKLYTYRVLNALFYVGTLIILLCGYFEPC